MLFRIDCRSVTGASIGDHKLESICLIFGRYERREKWIFTVGKIISSFILLIPFSRLSFSSLSKCAKCISEIDTILKRIELRRKYSLFEKLFYFDIFCTCYIRVVCNSHNGRDILCEIFALEIKSILHQYS